MELTVINENFTITEKESKQVHNLALFYECLNKNNHYNHLFAY